jgi:hypothetical protein
VSAGNRADKRYRLGELNSTLHSDSSLTNTTDIYTGLDKLSHAIKETNSKSVLKTLTGPIMGVCLSVEKTAQLPQTGRTGALMDSEGDTPSLKMIRVRVPELHAHLPDPMTYGSVKRDAAILLYPLFVSTEENVRIPGVGELVWVDFGNRQTYDDPIFIGPVLDKPYFGGFSSVDTGTSAQNGLNGNLNMDAPTGDQISSDFDSTGQDQSPTETDGEFVLREVETLNNEPIYERGKKIGEIEIAAWYNQNGQMVKVAADSVTDLQLLDVALFEDNGYRLHINSGFRTQREQISLYEKSRRESGPPTAQPGFSNHQSGTAVDISLWDIEKKKRYALKSKPKVFSWMLKNGPIFSLFWDEGKSIGEPWHWNYRGTLNKVNP